MIIPRKYITYLLVLFFCFLFSFSLNVKNSFALEDISITFTKDSSNLSVGQQVFGSLISTNQQYFSYSYLNVEFSPHRSSSAASLNSLFFFVMNCVQSFPVNMYYATSYPIHSVSSNCSSPTPKTQGLVRWSEILQDGESVTFTISETSIFNSSCPECEVCQTCPVIPENPYDNKLDNITRAIYVCAGVLLVLYFFYCIYRLIIKNSGVK